MTERRELAHHDGGGRDVAATAGGIPIEQRVELLREALTNPNVDPAKAVAMADLMFKLEDRDRQAEFNRSLIAAKAEIVPIFKRGHNKHQDTKYGKFEDIQRVTDPILERHGLDLSYKIGSEGNDVTVVPVIRHRNGWEWEGLPIRGPRDEGAGRSKIQAVGSSASYLQRYAVKGALNLRFDGEDDDGVPRPGDQLNDRQQNLLVDAQEAADAGNYTAWFGRLNAKDKAVLISSGHHSRLGGVAALPGAQQPPADQEERQQPPADLGGQSGTQQQGRRTPLQMVEAYEANVAKCADRAALLALQTEDRTAKWILGLKDREPELHARVIEANAKRFQEVGGAPAGDGSLFPGEE